MIAQRWHSIDVIARILAERLQGRTATEELRAMVRSPGTDWERVVGLASAQFVLPACAAALRDLDLSGLLGEELGSFLQAVHAANLERNDELRDELITVVGILNLIEIEPVLLKGAIRLADGLYPDQGWRMLRDLDLLVPEHRWEDATRSFQQFGYTPRGEANSEISMRRAGGPVSIDLHRELFSTRRRARLLGAQEMLRDYGRRHLESRQRGYRRLSTKSYT